MDSWTFGGRELHFDKQKYWSIFYCFPMKNNVLNETSCFSQNFGFLQVIGCVNGTHIPIKQLSENTHDYFSRNLCYTLS